MARRSPADAQGQERRSQHGHDVLQRELLEDGVRVGAGTGASTVEGPTLPVQATPDEGAGAQDGRDCPQGQDGGQGFGGSGQEAAPNRSSGDTQL